MRPLRRMLLGSALIVATAITNVTPAHADSGTFTSNDGPTCSWFGSGSLYNVSCSGYSRAAGGYVSYDCDYSVFGSSVSWSCRDRNGNSWRGSR